MVVQEREAQDATRRTRVPSGVRLIEMHRQDEARAGHIGIIPPPFDQWNAVERRALPRPCLEQKPPLQTAPHDDIVETARIERHETERVEMVQELDRRPSFGDDRQRRGRLGPVHFHRHRIEVVAVLRVQKLGQIVDLAVFATIEHEGVRRIERQAPAPLGVACPEPIEPQRDTGSGCFMSSGRQTAQPP